jgi:hypothetical protein
MNTAGASREVSSSSLDNLTLSRKEGWRDYTEAPKRTAPELLSKAQIRRLSEVAADIYKQRRDDWHNNLEPSWNLARCGADLTRARVTPLEKNSPVLAVQSTITDAIINGHADFGIYQQFPTPLP